MVFGPLKKINEGTLWRGNRSVTSFILLKQIFLNFYRHRDQFYNLYINKTDKNGILMMILLGLNKNLTKRNETHIWL